jgi:hypothetical protein
MTDHYDVAHAIVCNGGTARLEIRAVLAGATPRVLFRAERRAQYLTGFVSPLDVRSAVDDLCNLATATLPLVAGQLGSGGAVTLRPDGGLVRLECSRRDHPTFELGPLDAIVVIEALHSTANWITTLSSVGCPAAAHAVLAAT